jgi:hypothetical protein
MTFTVELLKSGMIVLDNGSELMETHVSNIETIWLYSPEPYSTTHGNNLNCWRLHIITSRKGFFEFKSNYRNDIDVVISKINGILESVTFNLNRCS